MRKTSQRKQQAYREGVSDGFNNSGHRWARHPFLLQYKQGYAEGVARRSRYALTKTKHHWLVAWFLRIVGTTK